MNIVWITRQAYNLLQELKVVSEQKAHFFESLNIQLSRENRRLIERLLAKNDVPLVESPDNIISKVVAGVEKEQPTDGIDLFEDEMGDPVMPRHSNDERKQQQESDQMEYQP